MAWVKIERDDTALRLAYGKNTQNEFEQLPQRLYIEVDEKVSRYKLLELHAAHTFRLRYGFSPNDLDKPFFVYAMTDLKMFARARDMDFTYWLAEECAAGAVFIGLGDTMSPG